MTAFAVKNLLLFVNTSPNTTRLNEMATNQTFIINTRCSNCFTFVFMYSVEHHKLNVYLHEV